MMKQRMLNCGMKTDIFLILIRVIDILLYIFRMLWYKVCTGSAFTTRIDDFDIFQGSSTLYRIKCDLEQHFRRYPGQ